MSDYPPTPTLDKMREVKDQSQAIGEFLEWLGSKGIFLGHHTLYEGRSQEQFVVRPGSTEELLAEFFEIDLNEAEAEKRAILDHIRSQP